MGNSFGFAVRIRDILGLCGPVFVLLCKKNKNLKDKNYDFKVIFVIFHSFYLFKQLQLKLEGHIQVLGGPHVACRSDVAQAWSITKRYHKLDTHFIITLSLSGLNHIKLLGAYLGA